MLRAYSNNITTNANSPIELTTNKILTNKNVTHSDGSANIAINAPGYYMITVDMSYASSTAGLATVQLYANNNPIADAQFSDTLVADSVTSSSFTTVVRANPGITYQFVNLTIKPSVDVTITSINVGVVEVNRLK